MHLSFWICLLLGHYLVKMEWRIIRTQMVSDYIVAFFFCWVFWQWYVWYDIKIKLIPMGDSCITLFAPFFCPAYSSVMFCFLNMCCFLAAQ